MAKKAENPTPETLTLDPVQVAALEGAKAPEVSALEVEAKDWTTDQVKVCAYALGIPTGNAQQILNDLTDAEAEQVDEAMKAEDRDETIRLVRSIVSAYRQRKAKPKVEKGLLLAIAFLFLSLLPSAESDAQLFRARPGKLFNYAPRFSVMRDVSHSCPNCGAYQNRIAAFNRNGTHSHVCPRCRTSWSH